MRARLVGAALVAGLLAGACSDASGPAISPTPSPALSPLSSPAVSTSSSPAPSSAGPTLPMPSGASVERDPSLLQLLPATVGGVQVSEEPESFAEAVKDPAFVASVDRAVFAIAVSGEDLTSGVIAHLREGVYSDQMFSDWRSSYDDGACAQSGGVAAHAQEALGGQTIYVTTCGGGLRIYHRYLASRGVIVSLFSTGPADLGGQLMAAIKG